MRDLGSAMCFRAFCVGLAVLSLNAAAAAECAYDRQNGFLSRVVAIESSGGAIYPPAQGEGAAGAPPLELRGKEVVLTFAQGPHSVYTGYILDTLDRYCAKATFFFSGSAAQANPSAVRDAALRGHTLALSVPSAPAEAAQPGIERGFASIATAAGGPVAPFLNAQGASLQPATLAYLKEAGVSLWNADIVSAGTEAGLTASRLANITLLKIREAGKGVVQFHDTRKVTVDALDDILRGLKASGFKVVQIVPAANYAPKSAHFGGPREARPAAANSGQASSMLLDTAKRRARAGEAARAERRRAAQGTRTGRREGTEKKSHSVRRRQEGE